MDLLPIEQLTDDEYELAELLEDHAEEIEPGDPFYLEYCQITSELAFIRTRLKSLAELPWLVHKGTKPKDIAAQLGCHYQTVLRHINDNEDVARAVALIERTHRMYEGPQIQQRTALLWRIALRNEHKAPRITISALDALNKMDGTYQKHTTPEQLTASGPKVMVQNFYLNEDNSVTHQDDPIDVEFETVTVSIPHAAE